MLRIENGKRLFFLWAAVAGLSGCAVIGRSQKDHRINPEALGKIEKGMAKEEVTNILGAPTQIIFSNKALDPLVEHAYVFEQETTCYTAISFAIVTFGNMDDKRDRVFVFLTPDGKVDHVGASLNASKAGYGFPFGQ